MILLGVQTLEVFTLLATLFHHPEITFVLLLAVPLPLLLLVVFPIIHHLLLLIMVQETLVLLLRLLILLCSSANSTVSDNLFIYQEQIRNLQDQIQRQSKEMERLNIELAKEVEINRITSSPRIQTRSTAATPPPSWEAYYSNPTKTSPSVSNISLPFGSPDNTRTPNPVGPVRSTNTIPCGSLLLNQITPTLLLPIDSDPKNHLEILRERMRIRQQEQESKHPNSSQFQWKLCVECRMFDYVANEMCPCKGNATLKGKKYYVFCIKCYDTRAPGTLMYRPNNKTRHRERNRQNHPATERPKESYAIKDASEALKRLIVVKKRSSKSNYPHFNPCQKAAPFSS